MDAIFLDRDGVIIRKAPEGEYITDWREVKFLPGALQAIASLSQAGFKVIIVTNQRGVATGKTRISRLNEMHLLLKQVVARHHGEITAVYCCTHDLPRNCFCRKPNPGMLFQAASEHKLSLSRCWMVGDSATDIAAGKRAHCKTVLIASSDDCTRWSEKPDIWVASLERAADLILAAERANRLSGPIPGS